MNSSAPACPPPPPPSLPSPETLAQAQKNQALLNAQKNTIISREIPMARVMEEYSAVPLIPLPLHPNSKHATSKRRSKLPHWYIMELLSHVKYYACSPSGGFGGVFFCLDSADEVDKEGSNDKDTKVATDNGDNNIRNANTPPAQKKCLFVIKGTASPAEEIFANHLMRFFNLQCPQCYLIEYAPKENIKKLHKKKKDKPNIWQHIKDRMEEISEGDADKERVEKALTRAFFLIMEFQEGSVSLEDLKLEDAQRIFELPEDLQEEYDKHDVGESNSLAPALPPTRNIFRDMGTMIVLDLLLNNWDRLPLRHVMEHEGNPGNIMFKRVHAPLPQNKDRVRHELVCIDQAIFAVHQENENDYIEKIERFFTSLAREERLDEVVSFIETQTGYKVSRSQETQIIEGIWDCVAQIRDKLPTTQEAREILTTMKDEIDAMKTGDDWEEVFENSIKAINVEFLLSVLDRMREFSREKLATVRDPQDRESQEE